MVFISYSTKNENLALNIYNECKSLDIDVWFAPKSIKIGESYTSTINKAIKNSNFFILILSKQSMESYHVLKELGLAVKNKKKILPIKIDYSDINEDFEYLLENIQWHILLETDDKDFQYEIRNFLNLLILNNKLYISSSNNSNTIKQKEMFNLVLGNIDEDIERYLVEAIAIDSQYYSEELSGQFDICLDWYQEDNSIYIFVTNEKNMVVGYINSMLVDKETFNAILNGDFIDMNISSDSIIQACIPNIYKMYFCSIAIDKNYRKYKNTIFKLLYNGFFKKLLILAKDGCFIEEIVADAVTPDGKNLAESFSLHEISSSTHNSRIYYSKLLPPKFKFYEGVTKEVFTQYKDYYENYLN